MSPKQAHAHLTGFPLATLGTTAFAALRKTTVENFINSQTELLSKVEETNRQWLDRMQSEASAVCEFASKLTAARSVPDAMTACKEWSTRYLEMMADDRKHLLADCQMFAETGARLLSKYWSQNGVATSS
jgi:hypothetical protein